MAIALLVLERAFVPAVAVEPDFDILGMGFDDYLVKPVSREELHDLVDTMLLRREYDEVMREYFSLVTKVAMLQQEKSAQELDANEEYAESTVKLEEIKDQARTALEVAMEEGKFNELFHEISVGNSESVGTQQAIKVEV